MKIVDVSEFYAERGGGVQKYVNAKLEAGAELGHEVVVVAPGAEDREQRYAAGRVCWVRSPRLLLDPRYHVLLRERAVHEILDRERPDVVEGSSLWSGGLFCARWRGAALRSLVFHQDAVAVYPQTWLGPRLGSARVDRLCAPYFAYLRALSRRYHLTITSGDWLAERLRGHGVDRVRAVPFGIDRTLFSPLLRDEAVRGQLLARCGLAPDDRLLVAVGRHHPEKRLGMLIDAIARLPAERRVGLIIYGDGPLRRVIEHKAARVAHVHVAGQVHDRRELAQVLASADALLHGSSAETFGLAVAEAICSGLPVIVPDTGGAAALAAPEYSECYAPGDVDSCASAIIRMVTRERSVTSAAAATAARQLLTPRQHFERLFALYDHAKGSASALKS